MQSIRSGVAASSPNIAASPNLKSLGLFAGLALASAATPAFSADTALPPALVTLTVTHFRSATTIDERTFVDASTSLAPHAAVKLEDRRGLPTLVMSQAVDVEVAVASADPSESYRPLGVFFTQEPNASGVKTDHDGSRNFTQTPSETGTIVINNRFLQTGADGQYEFFILIQRASDGAIGIIDPGMDNRPD